MIGEHGRARVGSPSVDNPSPLGYNHTMPNLRTEWSCVFAASALSLLAGCSHPATPAAPVTQVSQGVAATLTTAAPAHTGDDTLVITLADAQTHQPIGDANVTASAEAVSPRLPGANVSGRAQGNGVYNAPVVLAIATSYHINVQVERIGHPPVAFTFTLDVPN